MIDNDSQLTNRRGALWLALRGQGRREDQIEFSWWVTIGCSLGFALIGLGCLLVSMWTEGRVP